MKWLCLDFKDRSCCRVFQLPESQFRLQSWKKNDRVGGICCSKSVYKWMKRLLLYTPCQAGLELKVITEHPRKQQFLWAIEKDTGANISPLQSQLEVCRLIKGLVRDPVPAVYYWINKNDSCSRCVVTGRPSPVEKTLLLKFFYSILERQYWDLWLPSLSYWFKSGSGRLAFPVETQFENTLLTKTLLANLFSTRYPETRTLRATNTCS